MRENKENTIQSKIKLPTVPLIERQKGTNLPCAPSRDGVNMTQHAS